VLAHECECDGRCDAPESTGVGADVNEVPCSCVCEACLRGVRGGGEGEKRFLDLRAERKSVGGTYLAYGLRHCD
jgi:hypothetical protein